MYTNLYCKYPNILVKTDQLINFNIWSNSNSINENLKLKDSTSNTKVKFYKGSYHNKSH
jgi:hypothetical protein